MQSKFFQYEESIKEKGVDMNKQLFEMMKRHVFDYSNKYLRQDLVDCLTPKELVEYETKARQDLGLEPGNSFTKHDYLN